MALDVDGITDALVSHALASGWFERVNGHEPKNQPGNGLSAAVWAARVGPVLSSGLASTSAVVTFNIRLYTPMIQEPQDAIDPTMLNALSALLAAYGGDFTLGGLVREVDLLGANGAALSAEAGYLTQDQRQFRVFTITAPLIVNDAWDQEA
jgi:hypothetical protein